MDKAIFRWKGTGWQIQNGLKKKPRKMTGSDRITIFPPLVEIFV